MSREIFEKLRKDFYFLPEAIDLLGISRSTAYAWMRSGKLKTYKVGREVLVDRVAVDALPKADKSVQRFG